MRRRKFLLATFFCLVGVGSVAGAYVQSAIARYQDEAPCGQVNGIARLMQKAHIIKPRVDTGNCAVNAQTGGCLSPNSACIINTQNGTIHGTCKTTFNGCVCAVPTATPTPTPGPLQITTVVPPAGSVSGGQQIVLTGAFAALSTVTMGGSLASWFYTNGAGDTTVITVTTPAHDVGAVQIDLTPTSGSPYSKANAFAYLPAVFTDDTIVVGQTTVNAQHIIELRQAVDAMRAVAGLDGAPWTDPALAAADTIRAIHILDLRTYLDDAASQLGYTTSPYTDPSLSAGYSIKRIHIEELRQRIRVIAG